MVGSGFTVTTTSSVAVQLLIKGTSFDQEAPLMVPFKELPEIYH